MKLGRIKQWLGVIGAQSLEDAADRQRRNLEAEEAMVRQKAWGEKSQQEEDDMRQTILGDNIVNVHGGEKKSTNVGKLALATLLGSALPIGAYTVSQFAGKSTTVESTTINKKTGLDEDTTIRLSLPEWGER